MARVLQPGVLFIAVLFCAVLPASAQRGGFHGGGFHGAAVRGGHGGAIFGGFRGGAVRSHPGFHVPGRIAPRHGMLIRPGTPAFRHFPAHPQFRNPGFFHGRVRVGPRVPRHGFHFFIRTPFFAFGGFPFVPFFPSAPFFGVYSYGLSTSTYGSTAVTPPAAGIPADGRKSSAPLVSPPSRPRPGVLGFKDGSSVDVQDYWLTGDNVHYLKNDVEGVTPLSDVDLSVTQQLNHERQQPFVLESRPQ
ncbi:MAG: hypothetical protein HYX72_14255 [Acidobacteria bacterium]|nr:hypothetical protein [Acidobacteriota bacterium]